VSRRAARRFVGIVLAGLLLAAMACGGGGSGGPKGTGRDVFITSGCGACHSTGSSRVVGPGLAGLAERAATRVPGMPADDYIRQSITDPAAHLVDGYQNLMPNAFGSMSGSDLAALVEYLKAL
jgi:mono/diheme cytochrome c family protein